jgi:hypothetical protein
MRDEAKDLPEKMEVGNGLAKELSGMPGDDGPDCWSRWAFLEMSEVRQENTACQRRSG